MMKYIEVKQTAKYLDIILNRVDKHNAFDEVMIEEITSVFETITKETALHLVRISAHGKSFCAGADLNWMKKMKSYTFEENKKDSSLLQRMFCAIDNCPIPVIAKVHGSVLGGGTGIVACADYVLASSDSQFAFSEVKLGLIPAIISPFVASKIGVSHARALFLSGEIFDASKAHAIGLVHDYCDLEEIDSFWEKATQKYLVGALDAVKNAKKLLKNVLVQEKASNYFVEMISAQRISEEAQEGMLALLEKRKPTWSHK